MRELDDALRIKRWQDRGERFFRIPTSSELQSLVPSDIWDQRVTQACRRALDGLYPFFSHSEQELGWPPNFNLDPINQIDWPVGHHWLETARSGPPRNDIKLVWEASRFSLAYFLARQFAYSDGKQEKDEWAEAFWEMTESWSAQNPVNQSVAWACGQETAFRIMAMMTAALTMLSSSRTTPQRLALLELVCWQSAARIQSNINYAISQENNHALSEAVGLLTVGLLFPEFPESEGWKKQARSILDSEVMRQIYPDGSYVQHSMSYHRVMLDDLIWAIGLSRVNQVPLSSKVIERVTKSVEWLGEMIDEKSGRVPNYGANDGANVLPLSCSDYLDYRPTLQAAAEVCGTPISGQVLGPWSEKTLWLAGRIPEATPKTFRKPYWHAPVGGYHIMRGPKSQLMLRATTYKDRPSQCDMLHVDLWYGGYNILRDAGSFRYYHEDAELKRYFYSVEAHNTVQVGCQEQMVKGPNFLWFQWPVSKAKLEEEGQLQCEATFRGACPYTHSREILRTDDCYSVTDSIQGADCYTLRWRLSPDLEWTDVGDSMFETTVGEERYSISFDSSEQISTELTTTWESLYYAERHIVPAIVVQNVVGSITTKIGPCR